ncbi:5882_t:CDS:2, partial [Paraglomus occultum]
LIGFYSINEDLPPSIQKCKTQSIRNVKQGLTRKNYVYQSYKKSRCGTSQTLSSSSSRQDTATKTSIPIESPQELRYSAEQIEEARRKVQNSNL